jgi:hypothetical protein
LVARTSKACSSAGKGETNVHVTRYIPVALLAALSAHCERKPSQQPTPGLMIANLRSHVLGAYEAVCGRESGLALTQFTFDFAASGIDLGRNDAAVYRIVSTGSSSSADLIAQISQCSTGPCAETRRACITAGQSDGSGTIELAVTEEFRTESTWTIEVRQHGDAGVKSNSLSTTVRYAPPE